MICLRQTAYSWCVSDKQHTRMSICFFTWAVIVSSKCKVKNDWTFIVYVIASWLMQGPSLQAIRYDIFFDPMETFLAIRNQWISWMQQLDSFSYALLSVDCHHLRPGNLGSWKWRWIWPALCQWVLSLGHLHPQHASPWFLSSWESGQNWMPWHCNCAAKNSGLPWMGQRGLYHLHTPVFDPVVAHMYTRQDILNVTHQLVN